MDSYRNGLRRINKVGSLGQMPVTYLTHCEKYSSGKISRNDSKAEFHGSRMQITRYNRDSKESDITSYLIIL